MAACPLSTSLSEGSSPEGENMIIVASKSGQWSRQDEGLKCVFVGVAHG